MMEYKYLYEYMNLNYGRDFWIPLMLGNTCIIGQTIRQKRHVSISQAMMGTTWACQVVRKERSFSNLQIRWGAKNTKGLGWFPIWETKNSGQKKGGLGWKIIWRTSTMDSWLDDCWWKTRHSKDTKVTLRLTCTPICARTVGAWCCYEKPTARSVLSIHWILTYEDKFRLPRMRILTFT